MKNLWKYLVITFFLCLGQINLHASDWGAWRTIYREGENKVQISYKLANCAGTNLNGYSYYRTNNELNYSGGSLTFSFEYVDCENKSHTETIHLDLGKEGLRQDGGSWFIGTKVTREFDIKFIKGNQTNTTNNKGVSTYTFNKSSTDNSGKKTAINQKTITEPTSPPSSSNSSEQQAKILSDLDKIAQSNKAFQETVASGMKSLTALFNSYKRTSRLKELKHQRDEEYTNLKNEIKEGNSKLSICSGCGGNGIEFCTECNVAGYTECYICSGSGEQRCINCGGTGSSFGMKCTGCAGSGTVKCSTCSGAGKLLCGHCAGIGYKNCKSCSGTGRIIE